MATSTDSKALQELYEKGEYARCLEGLAACRPTKAVEHNQIIVECEMNANADVLLSDLQCTEDLQLDQQVLCDYNRALALSKYKDRFDEAIEILENRMLVLTEPFGVVDEKLAFKLFYLLAVIYIERKRNLQKALNLLQIINDKCDPLCSPPNLQYMKVKCYLAMGNIKKVKKKLKFLSPAESDLVRVYIEFIKCTPVKAFKLFHELIETPERKTIEYLNNETVLRANGQRYLSLYHLSAYKFPMPPEVKFNEAHLQMFSGNLRGALICYRTITPHFKFNPKVWLRLAECLIQNWLEDVRKARARCRSTSILMGQLGEHMNRKALINCQPGRHYKVRDEILVLARGCCLNAMMLLSQDESQLSFYPSNAPTENELKSFRVSLNLQFSYISLKLQDYFSAHRYSHEILVKMQPNSIQKVFAILYLAESLVRMQARRTNGLLNEISEQYREAQKLLQSETKLILQDDEYGVNVQEKLVDWNLDRLQYTLRYNNAVVLALQAKLTEADQEVQQLRKDYSTNFPHDSQLPAQLVLLDVYLSKKLGRKVNFDCNIPT
jgi:tetratricopeptide (TPR) repeat protein